MKKVFFILSLILNLFLFFYTVYLVSISGKGYYEKEIIKTNYTTVTTVISKTNFFTIRKTNYVEIDNYFFTTNTVTVVETKIRKEKDNFFANIGIFANLANNNIGIKGGFFYRISDEIFLGVEGGYPVFVSFNVAIAF